MKRREKQLLREIRRRVRRLVGEHGFAVVTRQSTDGRMTYGYTVGLSRRSEVDLILPADLHQQDLTDILNLVVRHVREAGLQVDQPQYLSGSPIYA
ncbi:hypothetical protein Dxin01_00841 [Deinococcus xinjiangensis]|uniref:Uncharacterized protein n=1 Tax=Deinococcus xinjiangensis TaxID=457454 RepID=A0ABP9VAA1_9DEIO